MQLVDIGANLTHESFEHDFAAVLARASTQGITRLVVTGASREGSEQALALARSHPGHLYATAGVHPHHAIDYDDATDARLRELARLPQVCAVGETGLDYHRNYSPREVQLRVFDCQLARMLVRPAGGVVRSLVTFDGTGARFHAATLAGRICGLRYARSRR